MESSDNTHINVLNIISKRSESGQIVEIEDILIELVQRGLVNPEDPEHKETLEIMLRKVLQENQDMKEILGRTGTSYYYSAGVLSETYARILVRKLEDPLWLISDTVRENSRLYPRPVPVWAFKESPFEMTREMIIEYLQKMKNDEAYRDISQATTSIGTPFLYSSRYLDADHASFLAELLDVGQIDNP